MDTGTADSDDEGDGSFWDSLRLISAVLGPCFALMRRTDSAAPLMGKFYKLMSELGGQLQDLFADNKPWSKAPWAKFKEEINEAHTRRWDYMHCEYHSAGYALDPNFLSEDVNGVNNGEVFQGLTAVIEKHFYDDEASQAAALQQYKDFRKQRGVFAAAALKVAARTVAAHEWWDMVAGGASELRKIAMRVLSKTSSASACERNWSAFAAVQTPKRNRLASKTLNDLVFLRVNLRLQQRLIDIRYADTVAEWIETTAVDADTDSDSEADDVQQLLQHLLQHLLQQQHIWLMYTHLSKRSCTAAMACCKAVYTVTHCN
jgi:hAT family C-terminal dimerisation region